MVPHFAAGSANRHQGMIYGFGDLADGQPRIGKDDDEDHLGHAIDALSAKLLDLSSGITPDEHKKRKAPRISRRWRQIGWHEAAIT